MASIATCPGCAAQLAIPDAATAASRAQCPECAAEFAMYETIQLALPQARIIAAKAAPLESLADALTPDDAAEGPARDSAPGPAGAVSETTDNLPAANSPLANWQACLEQGVQAANLSSAEPQGTLAEAHGPTPNETETLGGDEAAESIASLAARADEYLPRDQENTTAAPRNAAQQDAQPAHNILQNLAETPGEPAATPAKSATPPPQTVAAQVSTQRPTPLPARKGKQAAVLVTAASLLVLGLGACAVFWTQGLQAVSLTQVVSRFFAPAAADGEAEPAAAPSRPTELAASAQPPARLHVDRQLQPAAAEQLVAPQPPVTAAVFGERVVEAQAALPDFLTRPLSPDATMSPSQGKAYVALCRLAAQFHWMHQLGLSPQAQQHIQAGQAIFHQAAEQAREDLAHIASRWLAYDQRSTAGIFFVGTLEDARTVANQTHAQMALLGNPQIKLPVVFRELPGQQDQLLAVVGHIENTSDALPSVTAFYAFALPGAE